DSVAAPSLPAEYVQAAGELSTLEEVNAFLGATELQVMRDIAAEGSQPAITALCLSHGLRGLWAAPIRTPDGSTFLGLLGFFLRNVRDAKPGELALLERVRDLAAVAIDRDARTKELGRLALHDTLTGLPNRALAQDRLGHARAPLAHTPR